MNPSFSPVALRRLEPTLNKYVDNFIAGIDRNAKATGGVVEMNRWFHNFSFDVHPLSHRKINIRLLALLLWEKISVLWSLENNISS